jgi:hypothetical protein
MDGGRVCFGIIVLGAWYAIPHSAEVKFLLVINRTLILYMLHFLVKFTHTVLLPWSQFCQSVQTTPFF